MRLVPADDSFATPPPALPCLEISVRDPATGRVLALFSLRLSSPDATTNCMMSLPGTPGVGTDAPKLANGPIAGRIDVAQSPLSQSLSAWLSYLQARGKKPRSIGAFRQVVERAARDRGWSKPEDVTFAGVTDYLSDQPWKGSTYNRNLSAFRSLTRYLAKAKVLPEDPLEGAERAHDDGDDGSRASTLAEARAVILRAWIRDQSDRRCKGNRALYWLCLFAAACRVGEPAQWKRQHVVLEHEHPHVRWSMDVQKNNKRQEVALAPELARLLRDHLHADDRARAEAGLPPAGPDDLVFPVAPSRGTFRTDRDAAGVAAVDYRGCPYSPHSARKFFSTCLTAQGVPEKMVDRLMRHSGRVEHRYYDPPMAEQAAAVAKLPRLWPEQAGPGPARGVPVENSPEDLTRRGHPAEDRPGTLVDCSDQANSTERPGPVSQSPECQRSAVFMGLGRSVECLLRAAGQSRLEESGTVQAAPVMKPEIGIVGSKAVLAIEKSVHTGRGFSRSCPRVGVRPKGWRRHSGEVAERLKAAVC